MSNEVSSTIALSTTRQAAARQGDALSWRLAIPLIGGASAALWVLIGKVIALLIA